MLTPWLANSRNEPSIITGRLARWASTVVVRNSPAPMAASPTRRSCRSAPSRRIRKLLVWELITMPDAQMPNMPP